MKVSVTFDFSDDERQALAFYMGKQKMTRDDLRSWMWSELRSTVDSIASDPRDEPMEVAV